MKVTVLVSIDNENKKDPHRKKNFNTEFFAQNPDILPTLMKLVGEELKKEMEK